MLFIGTKSAFCRIWLHCFVIFWNQQTAYGIHFILQFLSSDFILYILHIPTSPKNVPTICKQNVSLKKKSCRINTLLPPGLLCEQWLMFRREPRIQEANISCMHSDCFCLGSAKALWKFPHFQWSNRISPPFIAGYTHSFVFVSFLWSFPRSSLLSTWRWSLLEQKCSCCCVCKHSISI